MKTLQFTQDMLWAAHKWGRELGGLSHSITRGAGNAAGRLGELALAGYLGVDPSDAYGHDLLYHGERLEVKTKRRTCDPQGEYDVSVAEASRHQTPDRYVFLSCTFQETRDGRYYQPQRVWYCGDLPYDVFWKHAELWRKGRTDDSNAFTTHQDMHNVKISQLRTDLVS